MGRLGMGFFLCREGLPFSLGSSLCVGEGNEFPPQSTSKIGEQPRCVGWGEECLKDGVFYRHSETCAAEIKETMSPIQPAAMVSPLRFVQAWIPLIKPLNG